jgi:hypothetical protein
VLFLPFMKTPSSLLLLLLLLLLLRLLYRAGG